MEKIAVNMDRNEILEMRAAAICLIRWSDRILGEEPTIPPRNKLKSQRKLAEKRLRYSQPSKTNIG